MCGRYTQKKLKKEVEERFEAVHVVDVLDPNYNACPGTDLPVITQVAPSQIVNAKWGLVSPVFPDSKPHVNATLERILEARTFSSCIDHKRCLVFADGYYEWKTVGKFKIPYYVTINNGELFAFAGIYENTPSGGLTFSLITLPPNSKLSFIHHRMPAILSKDQEKLWLNPDVKGKEAKDLIVQYPEEQLSFYSVSREVNGSGINDSKFILPVKYNIEVQGSLF